MPDVWKRVEQRELWYGAGGGGEEEGQEEEEGIGRCRAGYAGEWRGDADGSVRLSMSPMAGYTEAVKARTCIFHSGQEKELQGCGGGVFW